MKSLENVKVLAIVCSQWGDTGKGKLVDYFGQWADIIARGTGGANAGHTICIGGKQHIFHLAPSGMLHTGKINIIGNGVVLDPRTLLKELGVLKAEGMSCDNLRIAYNAKLVLPQHLALDQIRESGPGKIGTTGRGIGPAYEDHYRRLGLTVNDLLNPDAFKAKFEKNFAEKVMILRGYDCGIVFEILGNPNLADYVRYGRLDSDVIIEQYLAYGEKLKTMVDDTDSFLRGKLGHERILLEGAQGNMLSIDNGTYPFVTSSDCTVQGLAKGVGLTTADVDLTLHIVKAPYMTRVGDGPFPTEMGGERSAKWCATKGITSKTEQEKYPMTSIPSTAAAHEEGLNEPVRLDVDEFVFGVAVRKAGHEYGATTGRPRRTGWLDLPLLRYSCGIVGKHGKYIALTKVDVLNFCPIIRICVAYIYRGPDYVLGQRVLTNGSRIDVAIPQADVMQYCEPVYRTFPGWMSDISGAKSREELPANLKNLIKFVEEQTDTTVRLISVGPDREQTIFE